MSRKKLLCCITEQRISKERAAEIFKEANVEIEEIKWGGAREGAGRKKKDEDNVLKFQVRVSKKEKMFLNYAREHNLDYDSLMQG